MNKTRKFFHIDVTHENMRKLRKGAAARGFAAVAVWIKFLMRKDIRATEREQRKGEHHEKGNKSMQRMQKDD